MNFCSLSQLSHEYPAVCSCGCDDGLRGVELHARHSARVARELQKEKKFKLMKQKATPISMIEMTDLIK